jgi:Flp pilus assembly protein CpaB
MNKTFVLAAALLLAAPAYAGKSDSSAARLGYRAVNLPLPGHQLAGLAVDDRVDLMTTFDAEFGEKGEKRKKERVTATILQNVRVLGVDASGSLITLELNPNEAQYAVLFVGDDKELWLSKRAKGDDAMKPMEMAVARKLFR